MPQVVQAIITIQDAKGKQARMGWYYDALDSTWGDNPLEAMTEYTQELVKRLDTLINGAVVGVALSVGVPLPAGIAVSPALTSDVEEKARVTLRRDGVSTSFEIPAFDHSLDVSFNPAGVYWGDAGGFFSLLLNATEALDWAGFGRVWDARGTVKMWTTGNFAMSIRKVFKARR